MRAVCPHCRIDLGPCGHSTPGASGEVTHKTCELCFVRQSGTDEERWLFDGYRARLIAALNLCEASRRDSPTGGMLVDPAHWYALETAIRGQSPALGAPVVPIAMDPDAPIGFFGRRRGDSNT